VVAYVHAVSDVSFGLKSGETLGLVGESGCGKSTLGRALIRLEEVDGGSVEFLGIDIASLKESDLRKARRDFQMIFQDPYSALNPKMTVFKLLAEPILNFHPEYTKSQVRARVEEIMADVGLRPEYVGRYPHEFSGGQRQRISIGRALAASPKLIVCDEPVSALDVSIQAQILNLLMNLQEKYKLSFIFISHDLHVVRHVSKRIAVMYLGRIVEIGENESLFSNTLHPYTRALLSAVPSARVDAVKERMILQGDVPSPINPPSGCAFHPRCPYAKDVCKQTVPELRDFGNGHMARCFRIEEISQN
jgi:oligopeptide/dipeptide ABC transporter ATP-binding protein